MNDREHASWLQTETSILIQISGLRKSETSCPDNVWFFNLIVERAVQ